MIGRAPLVLATWAALACGCGSSDRTPAPAISAADAATAQRLVLDVREPADFAAGHDADALNLQWGWKQLPSRVEAYVPDPATPLAVRAAEDDGNLAPFERLLKVLGAPYDDQPEHDEYRAPPRPEEVVHQTFCGT